MCFPVHRPITTTESATSDTVPDVTLTATMTAAEIEAAIAAVEIGRDRTTTPTLPSPADFALNTEYASALQFYTEQKARNDAYNAELALHQAYLAAVNVVRSAEMRAANGLSQPEDPRAARCFGKRVCRASDTSRYAAACDRTRP